ncbi:terminase [Pseudomonas nicosulfuronedens]|uniref:terminase n=2 Tax=Pseudomonas nicosulfuronedens TaxID=2571105 RepID=UPI00244B0194|nr:terminase [Pseudomonas nicosulfuronedens]MDH1978966.1 terminase [Pseudomonas nicosulfuronedens]MDH2028355.1 terminase [Pseudomonas nicosulfuronedens]
MAARVMHDEPLVPLPKNEEELARCLADPEWRLFSGCLYKIMIKGDDGEDATVLPFRPNRAQRRFLGRLWHRNLILKARQLGFTTLVAILWLDHALFNANQRCGIIAQDREAAETIFRDKVKFAYENLPDEIRERFPVARDSAIELLFAHNNSSVRVATSMRSGTIHRLHVSEFGKICAKYPDKAKEVVTGSIPAVPTNGVLVIESTAEGNEGQFFDMVNLAQEKHAGHQPLTPKDYRFHFYAWWMEPKYRLDSSTVVINEKEHKYFDKIEAAMGCRIDPDQRAWYIATKRADFAGAEENMWQEYPSTPAEAFQVSTEGNYYADDMLEVRRRGGITRVPVLDLPVNTFWDIGNHDGCAIWFHQELRGEDRFIGYYEEHYKDLRHYASELQRRGHLYGTHYLPHDAEHKRLGDYNRSVKEMLQALLPGHRFIVVPRITELINGIQQARKHLKGAFFDEEGAKQGISRLENYRKKYSRSESRYVDEPDKSNGCSEGADAYRQYAQAKELGLIGRAAGDRYIEAPPPDWRT